MVRLNKLLLAGLSIIASTAANAHDYSFYMGADLMLRHMDYQQGYGKHLIKTNIPAGNFYAGLQFHKNFAVEFGHTRGKKQQDTLTTQDAILNVPLMDTCVSDSHKITTKLQSWHFSITGFSDLYEDTIQLIGSIGVAMVRLNMQHTLSCLAITNITTTKTQNLVAGKKYTLVPRLALGLQYKLNKTLALRSMITWEQTSKIKTLNDDLEDNIYYKARPKDSINYSLGIVAKVH